MGKPPPPQPGWRIAPWRDASSPIWADSGSGGRGGTRPPGLAPGGVCARYPEVARMVAGSRASYRREQADPTVEWGVVKIEEGEVDVEWAEVRGGDSTGARATPPNDLAGR